MKLSRRQLRRLIEAAIGPDAMGADPDSGGFSPGKSMAGGGGGNRTRSKQDFRLEVSIGQLADKYGHAQNDNGSPNEDIMKNKLYLAIVAAHNKGAFEFRSRNGTDATKRRIDQDKIYFAREGGKGKFVTMNSGDLSDDFYDTDGRIDHQMNKFIAAYHQRKLVINKKGNKVIVSCHIDGFGSWTNSVNYSASLGIDDTDKDQINFLDFLDKSTSVRPPRLEMK